MIVDTLDAKSPNGLAVDTSVLFLDRIPSDPVRAYGAECVSASLAAGQRAPVAGADHDHHLHGRGAQRQHVRMLLEDTEKVSLR